MDQLFVTGHGFLWLLLEQPAGYTRLNTIIGTMSVDDVVQVERGFGRAAKVLRKLIQAVDLPEHRIYLRRRHHPAKEQIAVAVPLLLLPACETVEFERRIGHDHYCNHAEVEFANPSPPLGIWKRRRGNIVDVKSDAQVLTHV